MASFADQALTQGAEPAALGRPLRRHLLVADGDAPYAYDAMLATALLEAAGGEAERAEHASRLLPVHIPSSPLCG